MNTPEAITRAFDIIASLNRIPVVVPWLQRMTRHSDAHVQSKASLIFCRLYGNPMLVERQLGSADNRVRANAIEALWNIDTLAARNILDKAARDGHHRVAANAVLGLYLLRSPGAAERLTEMASSESASFRASAAWAMGQTGDDAFQPLLRTLLSDEAENVRGAAQRALERLHCGEPAHAAV
jgi:HEAT repeat protein